MGECRSRKSSRLVVAMGLVIVAAGCRSASPRTAQTGVLHDPSDVKVNREQLRFRVRSLVGPMTGRMESAADNRRFDDQPDGSTGSARVEDRRRARDARLALPTRSVCRAHRCLGAVRQMSDYFESGPGKTRLGPASAPAAVACRTSEDHLAGVAASATTSGDVSKVRDFVRRWAAEHPITGTIAARQPILSIDVRNELADS